MRGLQPGPRLAADALRAGRDVLGLRLKGIRNGIEFGSQVPDALFQLSGRSASSFCPRRTKPNKLRGEPFERVDKAHPFRLQTVGAQSQKLLLSAPLVDGRRRASE